MELLKVTVKLGVGKPTILYKTNTSGERGEESATLAYETNMMKNFNQQSESDTQEKV